MKILLMSALTLVTSGKVLAASNIVYGDDNRMEAYESPAEIQSLGDATAAMIPTKKMLTIGAFTMLPPSTLKQDMKLCEGEAFSEQLSAALCSGFLVGPDLLVTAGHCITSEFDCEKQSWVFDYKLDAKTKRAKTIIDSSKVYKCSKIINAKLVGNGTDKIDYSLIKLDRPVVGRAPLKYRTEGKLEDASDVFVIGYPSGLPQKYAPGSVVVSNTDPHYFQANLDTFGGNSGSSVFNARTNEVEGILVRGAKDYVKDPVNNCYKVNKVDNDITDLGRYGESVSRITDIPSLKYREALFAAVKSGDLEKVKELVAKEVSLEITDNEMNTTLHYAVQGAQTEMVKFLLEKKINGDAVNLAGQSANAMAASLGDEQLLQLMRGE